MNNLFFSNAGLLNEDPRNPGQFTGLTTETSGDVPQQGINPLVIGAGAYGGYKAGIGLKNAGNKLLASPISQNIGSTFSTGDTQGLKNIAAQQGWFGYNPADQAALPNTYGRSVPGAVQDVTQGYTPPTVNPNINTNFYSPPPANQLYQPDLINYSQRSPRGFDPIHPSSQPVDVSGGVPGVELPSVDELNWFDISGVDPLPTEVSGWGGIAPSNATGSIDSSGIFTADPNTTMGMLDDLGGYGGGIADFTSDSVGAAAEGAGDLIDATGANTTGMSGLLSKAGSLAGLGLSAYDIANSGINAGNALGLVGSGLGTAAAFSTNPALMALGPWGWGLAGLGTVGSLMDWW